MRSLPEKNLKVACVQMTSTEDVEANFQFISGVVERLGAVAELICFPENSLFMRCSSRPPNTSFTLKEDCFHKIARLCERLNCHVLLGSLPLLQSGKVMNAMVQITPKKNIQSVYEKIHLFDVNISGGVRESDQFQHGAKPKLIEVNGWKLGLSICYDIRFAELYTEYQKAGAHVLLAPSAFLAKTGQYHWHVLNRARAIENQCFVVSAAQVGVHSKGHENRRTYGHALVVDPWGEILADLGGEKACWQVVELAVDRLKYCEEKMPMSEHRRLI